LKKKIKEFLGMFRKLSAYSKMCFRLGFYLMLCFYIVAVASYFAAPYVANYFRAMAVFIGCLEAAPASLAAGVCAGFLCDMIFSSQNHDGKSSDDK
jgi:hypothetical protein